MAEKPRTIDDIAYGITTLLCEYSLLLEEDYDEEERPEPGESIPDQAMEAVIEYLLFALRDNPEFLRDAERRTFGERLDEELRASDRVRAAKVG